MLQPEPGSPSERVILITGGWTEGSQHHSAEIYIPQNGSACSLSEFPERRKFHSQEAGLVCGGSSRSYLEYKIYNNCYRWSPDSGVWSKSHTFGVERTFHVSWSTEAGLYLIGGHGVASNNAEKIMKDGSVTKTLRLKDLTVLACAIPDPDNNEVTITGGVHTGTRVSVYSDDGWKRDLASLRGERWRHACTSFKDEVAKILIVTGGSRGLNHPLDSTEVYRDGTWRIVAGQLPAAMYYLRATVISNRVLLFGGFDGYNIKNSILEYNQETEKWFEIGSMRTGRYGHGVSVVSLDEYARWCH